jgi:hypothetical protein
VRLCCAVLCCAVRSRAVPCPTFPLVALLYCSKGPQASLLTHDKDTQDALYERLCRSQRKPPSASQGLSEADFVAAVAGTEDLELLAWLNRMYPPRPQGVPLVRDPADDKE